MGYQPKKAPKNPSPPTQKAKIFHNGCEMEKIKRKGGLTDKEGKVMDSLINSWNEYIELEKQHPNEINDFGYAIHKCQDLLAIRIARRMFPEGWPMKKQRGD